MEIFFVFVFFLVGLISAFYNYFFLLLVLPLVLYLFFIRKYRCKAFLFLLATLASLFLVLLYPKGSDSVTEITGVLIKRKENYALVMTMEGTYYVLDKGKLGNLFSIVSLSGSSSVLSFSHYENGFSFKEYLKTQGVFYQFIYKTSEVLFQSPYSLSLFTDYAFSFLNESARNVAESLLFASSLNLDSLDLLNEMGLLSMFSVSGFHLSFLLSLPDLFLGEKKMKPYCVVKMIIAFVFLLLSSFRYGLIRYFLSSVFALIAQFQSKRKWTAVERLSMVSLIMLFFAPYSLMSSGFYYSFPFLFYLRFIRKEKRSSKKIFFFAVLFFFFYPYKLYSQYGFSLLSSLLQLILLPYSHLLFFLSILLLVFPPLGAIFNFFVSILEWFCSLSQYLHIFIVSGKPSVIYTIVFYGMLILIPILQEYGYRGLRNKMMACLSIYCLLPFFPNVFPRYEIDFIDVDQGSSTLVINGYDTILIDTGGKVNTDMATSCLIPYFRKKKITSLTGVVITHLDYDHYGALASLKENFSIEHIYYAEDFLKEEDNAIRIGTLSIQNLNDYRLSTDTNTSSGVYRFKVKETDILITGDAPKAIERKLLFDGKDIDVDILALGHHGSSTSSDKEFLESCSPSLCIISCGENNSYGFPTKETLATLQELNLAYRRTDQESTVEIKL